MLFTGKIGAKGQLTIPQALCERLRIKPGTKIVIKVIREDFIGLVVSES